MSWDIILFNSTRKIDSIAELDESQLVSTDFCAALATHFETIVKDDNHREIKGEDFAIEYFKDNELVSNKLLNLYGEAGLYELIILARIKNWQIFDTGNGCMIDLENPGNNGYENFKDYLQQVNSRLPQ
ncbi:hypothetical protein [Pedobacter foliorum]|uniref:hypothetical protein n=1 Tax=Pedobacter foliorum TaxID=2739058 RepID=UPI001566E4D4|nr:hypothetical protein [Pedobacter foliorum]NRF37413.1 hypothetical protein [Pedobacter foliorum]